MGTDLLNKKIDELDLYLLQVLLDNESLTIFLPSTPDLPIVYWHISEVEEDANVAISMINALHLFHTDKKELVKRLGYTIIR